jgi:tetratricopeptide (TPR) repeat protein
MLSYEQRGKMSRVSRVGLLVLVIASAFLGCQSGSAGSTQRRAAQLAQKPWVVVNSARFEIFSSMSEEATKALALDLERFHALVYATTTAAKRPSSIPTRIYAFDNPRDYGRFGPEGSAGVFMPGLRSNAILVTDYSVGLGAADLILHEYVHFVVRNNTATAYPTWYDEGFADFLSTAQIHKDMIAVGATPRSHIRTFEMGEWVPIRQIISAIGTRSYEFKEEWMFYPEAWALVHYLTLDRPREAGSFPEQLARYLELTKRGAKPAPAFETAFGEDLSKIDFTIRRKIDSGKMRVIGIPIASLDFDDSEPSVRIATEAEASARMGVLALRTGQMKEAGQYFRQAAELDPTNATAQAGLGCYHKFGGRFEEAEPFFEKALELSPQDPWIQLDLAEFYMARAEQATSRKVRRSDLAQARRLFRAVIEMAPEIPEAHAKLGRSYLLAGESAKDGIDSLEKAFKILPSSFVVAMSYVAGNLALGERAIAEDVMRLVFASRMADKKEKGSFDEELDEMEKSREKAEQEFAKLPEIESETDANPEQGGSPDANDVPAEAP